MRKTYVWALDVVLPEEPIAPADHNPADGFCGCHYENGDVRWPKNRKFLSEQAARHRAHMFEYLGATVTVIRSEPVTFPSVASTRQRVTETTINGLRAIVEDLK